jgi:predicted GIY-YIG superfamily endonuclease
MCGVYYLWDGAQVIYVGSSRLIERRVSDHRSKGLDFAGYFIDECAPSELFRREAAAIAEFRPILNKNSVLGA